jgi:hypothetical protein
VRPPPLLEGTLDGMPVADLLAHASSHRLSGTLELVDGNGVAAAIRFVDGRPAKAWTRARVYLVPLLAELGILHASEVRPLLARLLAGTRLHGLSLVAEGVVTAGQVAIGLREQLTRQVTSLANLAPTTTYRLFGSYDALREYGGEDDIVLDPVRCIWATLRAAAVPRHTLARLARLGHASFRLRADTDAGRFGFDAQALSIVSVLRRWPCQLADVVILAGAPYDEVARVVYALLLAEDLEVVSTPGDVAPGFETAAADDRARQDVSGSWARALGGAFGPVKQTLRMANRPLPPEPPAPSSRPRRAPVSDRSPDSSPVSPPSR